MKRNLKIIILSIIVLASMTFEVIGMSTSFGSFLFICSKTTYLDIYWNNNLLLFLKTMLFQI